MKHAVAFANPQRARTSPWVGSRDSGAYYHNTETEAEAFLNWNPRWALAYDDLWRVRPQNRVQISTADEAQRFRTLAENWRRERGITSSVTKMVLCPSYQRIMVMGERAIPFILRELEKTRDDPDHWFWALEMITEADPIPVDAYGDTVRMADAWLTWAQGKYVW